MPLSASSNLPGWRVTAPVKAPFSCPNMSDSSSVSTTAAQLTTTNGPSGRSPASWMARATSSLPVPLSPVTSTMVLPRATRPMVLKISFIARVPPTMAVALPATRAVSMASSSRGVSSRRTTAASSSSTSTGLWMYSSAPFCMASMVVSMSWKAVITTTCNRASRALRSGSTSSPERPGMRTSRMTRSGCQSDARASPVSASCATAVSNPCARRCSSSVRALAWSSSTTRMRLTSSPLPGPLSSRHRSRTPAPRAVRAGRRSRRRMRVGAQRYRRAAPRSASRCSGRDRCPLRVW